MEMIGAQNGVVQVPNLAANNLLQKFFITSNNHFCSSENGEEAKEKGDDEGEEEKDLELSLGLSLNGQFGTDLARSRKRKNFELSRSSSIPEGFVFDEQRSGDGGDMRRNTVRPVMFQLDRTRSLPVVTEMETKRNRSEKTRAFLEFPKEKNRGQADHGGKDGFTLSSGGNDETAKTRAFMEFQVSPTKEQTKHAQKDGFTLSPGHNGVTAKKRVFMKFQVPTAKEEVEHARKDGFTLSSGSNNERKNTRAFLEFQIPPKKEETNHIRKDGFTLNHKSNEKTRALMEFPVPSAKKVTDHSQKDGFTLSPGSNGKTEKTRAFLDFQVPPKKEQTIHGQKDGFTPTPVNDKGKNGNTLPPRKKKNAEVSGMEKARNFLEDMPCVSTREVGADGKRVEGFLYWYGGNKEEVKIVCVCHGSFLSPAEFVKHGGVNVKDDGGDDDVTMNPLRHIVVKLSSSSL